VRLDDRGDIGDRTVAVSHPGVIRAAIIHAIKASPPSFWRIDAGPLALRDLRGNNAH